MTKKRLVYWKGIANHLGTSVRTAQRYEKEYGLPVHRPRKPPEKETRQQHNKSKESGSNGALGETVWALVDEIDAWQVQRERATTDDPRETRPWTAWPIALAAAAALLLLLAGAWFFSFGMRPTRAVAVRPDGSASGGAPLTAATPPTDIDSEPPSKLMFISEREGLPAGLYEMNPDGTDQRRLSDSDEEVVGLSVSPDGEQVALLHRLGPEGNFRTAVYVHRADGTEPNFILDETDLGGALPQDLDWSPDGHYLGVAAGIGCCTGGVWLIELDTYEMRQVVSGSYTGIVRFSPDGQWIIHNRRQERDAYAHPLLKTRLSDGLTEDVVPECCSEDGVVMQADWGPGTPAFVFNLGLNLWTANEDGSNRMRLTHDGDPRRPVNYLDPVWSPGQTRIAYTHSSGDGSQISVMNADGTDRRQLTNLGTSWRPAWRVLPDFSR